MATQGTVIPERETRLDAELARLRQGIRVGLEQARAGKLVDGEQVFAELEHRNAEPHPDG
jgi:predicted transcriptional regulator